MKLTVSHTLKRPDREQFSSRSHGVSMEVDVPADVVAKGKDALREYVASVTAEVRSYVEEALETIRVEQGEREPDAPAPAPPSSRAVPNGHTPSRPGVAGNGARSDRSPTRARAQSNGHANGTDRSVSRNGATGATHKQIAFARNLGARVGYSVGELSALCEETYGRRLEEISKADASSLIEQLRSEAQS